LFIADEQFERYFDVIFAQFGIVLRGLNLAYALCIYYNIANKAF